MSSFGLCCNPLADASIVHSKSLRKVSERVLGLFPLLNKQSKICDRCRKTVDAQNSIEIHEYPLIIKKMIERFFSSSTSKAERELIMNFLPDSWSTRRKASFFSTTRYFASNVTSKKPESQSCVRSKKHLPVGTIDTVKEFYENDDNSRIMPGMKDVKCVRVDNNVKVFVQKRLVLYNIRELYLKFKDLHPDVKVGMTKFAEARPVHCVLAGSSGTHSVCVCVYHQNVKLMLKGLDISAFTSGTLTDYKEIALLRLFVTIQPIVVTSGHVKSAQLLSHLNQICFIYSIRLKTHSFIAKKQSSFFTFLKENLREREVLVSLDLAENYAFVAQDAAQAFHYNNDQCTLVTVVLYYMKDSKLCHQSMVIMSDNLVHDTVAVHCIQKIITDWIKLHLPLIKKIIYFTDGAPQHFKNRFNFSNLKYHKHDFQLEAEWHFDATAHGKNACDGLGASVKSNARRESLQRSSENQILTPHQLYVWAKEKFDNIEIYYSSKDEYLRAKEFLEIRFDSSKTVSGTLSYHSVRVLEETGQLEFKKFSSSGDSVLVPKFIRNKRPCESSTHRAQQVQKKKSRTK
ncbi:hypothetical protein QAD02_024081 [Eretmocerus hayati]|uniref:Uncharacterized protein n=1 Tax=Eretmocerus hayati TaxID=131215 RepID=A0ACC2PZV2_9HYME|nr:hypothetical protein QAD02_024081 [Eretmocerus hayati]